MKDCDFGETLFRRYSLDLWNVCPVPSCFVLSYLILSYLILSRAVLSRFVLYCALPCFEADSRSKLLFSEAPGFSFLAA